MGQSLDNQPASPWTLEEIGQLVSASGDPAETFANIVQLAQASYASEASSLYLLDSERATLVLSAAVGLNPEGVGRMGVRIGDGPVGRVAEFRTTHVDDSCLAVPVIYRGLLQGVVVVQRHAPGGFCQRDGQTLAAGAAQIAPLVSHARTDVRRRLEWQLVQRAKAEVLETLAPGLAHELNNKLMPIASYAELMLEEAERLQSVDLQEGCATIRESAFEAAHVIEQMLLMCTTAPADHGSCDLAAVLRQAVASVQPAIAAAGVRLVVDVPAQAVFRGDAAQLEQVCMHLLRNATEALAKVARRELTIGLRIDAQGATITVADTGVGIHPDVMPRVFEPYFTTKESRSHGIGLGLCFGIVKQHGGDIRVVSTVDGGTTMSVTLPTPADAPAAAAPAPDASRPFARIAPLRVLVIDDDERMLQLVAAVLESKLGCRVERACNGLDARAALEHDEFDLVLSDIRMPKMDGVELLDWITLNRPNVLTRTMFMTGDLSVKGPCGDIERAGRPVLKKPFSLDALVSAAKRVMTEPGRVGRI